MGRLPVEPEDMADTECRVSGDHCCVVGIPSYFTLERIASKVWQLHERNKEEGYGVKRTFQLAILVLHSKYQ